MFKSPPLLSQAGSCKTGLQCPCCMFECQQLSWFQRHCAECAQRFDPRTNLAPTLADKDIPLEVRTEACSYVKKTSKLDFIPQFKIVRGI